MYQDNQPDPLDEFLAQLLKDFPDILPEPITISPPLTLSPLSLSLVPPTASISPTSLSSPTPSLLSSPSSPSPSLSSSSPSPSSSSSSSSSSSPSPPSPATLASVSSLWSYWSPPPPTTYPSARPRYRASDAHPTCNWVTSPDSPLSCGARVSKDAKEVCAHFRDAHGVRGNEKVIVSCNWRGCRAAPMQRGSLIRHVLTVHLGMMRWRCERCRKMFSRKGTVHLCAQDE